MGNGAIAANPPSYAEDITTHGSDWLWAVFAVMALSALMVTVMGFSQMAGKRAFHFFSAAILFTASVAYFAMASNLGKTPVAVEFTRFSSHLWGGAGHMTANPYRSIWYARYIDWTITTPLLLLDLLLATGLPTSAIFFTIFMDIVMIETGLIGALVPSSYKWGFYTFGCAAMLYVFWVLVGPARSSARALGADVGSVYLKSAAVLGFLWFLYPIAWGLADGGNVISSDSEMVFYGVLDVLAKPGFIFFHLFSLRGIEYERFALQSGHFSVGAVDGTLTRHENVPFQQLNQKHGNGHAVGAANGTANGGTLHNATVTNNATSTAV